MKVAFLGSQEKYNIGLEIMANVSSDIEGKVVYIENIEDLTRKYEENEFKVIFIMCDDIDSNLAESIRIIKSLKEKMNIIFISSTERYCYEGYIYRISGYIKPPYTSDKIMTELDNLRYPVEQVVYVRTFGLFDIFVNDNVVCFGRKPAKELLAILIDKKGSTVTRREIADILFEDKTYSRSSQSYITQIIKSLKETLKEYGIEDILISDKNTYAIDTSKIKVDMYSYISGDKDSRKAFRGEYMEQYKWGRGKIGAFANKGFKALK